VAMMDNDVLVEIFDLTWKRDRKVFKKVMEYLTLRFSRIWISDVVKEEFLRYNRQKRGKLLKRHMKKYPILKYCPIKVAEHERELFIPPLDEGEADALYQISKLHTSREYSYIRSISFVSNDQEALKHAQNEGIQTLSYNELRTALREMGVIL